MHRRGETALSNAFLAAVTGRPVNRRYLAPNWYAYNEYIAVLKPAGNTSTSVAPGRNQVPRMDWKPCTVMSTSAAARHL